MLNTQQQGKQPVKEQNNKVSQRCPHMASVELAASPGRLEPLEDSNPSLFFH